MSRPVSPRKIENMPSITWFKPVGVPLKQLEEVVLTLDEIEAVRLADVEGLYQEQVANQMNVSRPTVGRILTSARKKMAEALVLGKAIRMEGGSVYTGAGMAGKTCCGRVKNEDWVCGDRKCKTDGRSFHCDKNEKRREK